MNRPLHLFMYTYTIPTFSKSLLNTCFKFFTYSGRKCDTIGLIISRQLLHRDNFATVNVLT